MFNSVTDLVNEVIYSLTVLRDSISENDEEQIHNELHSVASTYAELLRTVDEEDKDSVDLFEKHMGIVTGYHDEGIEKMLADGDKNDLQIQGMINELNVMMENKIS